MPLMTRKRLSAWLGTFLVAAAFVEPFGTAWAAEVDVPLKDGRVLRGKPGKTSGVAESPSAASPDNDKLQTIWFLDDNLRRTFFSDRLVDPVGIRPDENRQVDEKFKISQRVVRSGQTVSSVGAALRIDPFDEFGRRTYTLNTPNGPLPVIQGITEITPQWTRVEGIKTYAWDMRIGTSTIPPDILHKILLKHIDPKGTKTINVEGYKRIARFYLQSERYEKAEQLLEDLLKEFPDRADLKEQLTPFLRSIKQMSAKRLLAELKFRRDTGQHRLVRDKLEKFPAEGVGGEILQGVREMIDDYHTGETRRQGVVQHIKTLSGKVADMISRENLKPILEEIAAEIGPNTLNRMAAFLQNADDPQMSDNEKLALAISGWVLGADAATVELPTAIAAYRVRRLIREYLKEPDAAARLQTFDYLKQESRADAAMVAKLLAHMKPPLDPPPPVAEKPGYYQIEAEGEGKDSRVTYYLQLPPEYDPYRRYATIVTLNPAGPTAELQVDWWAGAWGPEGTRTGQAGRHGYIVLAPVWGLKDQRQYNYSAREHAAVLDSLRDACRRFAIDTDRVYLSGHSMGGDAAWDIGLAHPGLWAGVIPIVAEADRYCTRYWENAKNVPFYFVSGELDPMRMGRRHTEYRRIGGKEVPVPVVDKPYQNPAVWDRCIKRGFNTTLVEYQGRGHDDFHDEILRMFDWMHHFRRNLFPSDFACATMRPGDNFFWWVTLEGLPPRSLVDPRDWPPPSNFRPVEVKASIKKVLVLEQKSDKEPGIDLVGPEEKPDTAVNPANDEPQPEGPGRKKAEASWVVNVTTGTSQAWVWLSPEMFDRQGAGAPFGQRAIITLNDRRLNRPDQMIRPDMWTMLEDVRTRADRQHPFWARLEGATGRGRGE